MIGAQEDRVVIRRPIHHIKPGPATDHIACGVTLPSLAALHRVVSRPAPQAVRPETTKDAIITFAAIGRVITVIAEESIAARASTEDVVPRARIDRVITNIAPQLIITSPAVDRVIPSTAIHDVVPAQRVDHVITRTSTDHIRTRRSRQHVITTRARDRARLPGGRHRSRCHARHHHRRQHQTNPHPPTPFHWSPESSRNPNAATNHNLHAPSRTDRRTLTHRDHDRPERVFLLARALRESCGFPPISVWSSRRGCCVRPGRPRLPMGHHPAASLPPRTRRPRPPGSPLLQHPLPRDRVVHAARDVLSPTQHRVAAPGREIGSLRWPQTPPDRPITKRPAP